MKPLVSVITPVYNGEKYLDEAIESVLAQTYSPIELIIINDGSSDNTEKIVSRYSSKIRYFSQTNQGPPAAMNYGLHMAKGAYIAFLDADDLHMPDKTALQVEFLEMTPHIDYVFGYVEQFLSPELEIKKKWACPSEIIPGHLAGASLFRKECFEKMGLSNEQQIGAFIDWVMRATDKGIESATIVNKVLRRRIHGNNLGIQAKDPRLEYLKIIKDALKRRNLAG